MHFVGKQTEFAYERSTPIRDNTNTHPCCNSIREGNTDSQLFLSLHLLFSLAKRCRKATTFSILVPLLPPFPEVQPWCSWVLVDGRNDQPQPSSARVTEIRLDCRGRGDEAWLARFNSCWNSSMKIFKKEEKNVKQSPKRCEHGADGVGVKLVSPALPPQRSFQQEPWKCITANLLCHG